MNYLPKISRRSFVIGSAAAGGGLAIGFDLPFGPKSAEASASGPELGVWVVVCGSVAVLAVWAYC